MDDGRYFRFSPSVWIVPAFLVVAIWAVFLTEMRFHLDLSDYGIRPRSWEGLIGILVSPFLHGSLEHIASNTPPLFILTAALVYFYRALSLKVLLYGILLSGGITWLIGRDANHIGASGLIYVLVSFIFFKGMMTRYYRLVALSFAVVVMYGGMVWYLFPGIDDAISWEGHLGGFVSGFGFAARFRTPDYSDGMQFEWQRPDYDPSQDKFMQRFDENGNFVNPPPPEPEEMSESQEPEPIRVSYRFVPREEDKEQS